MIDKNNKSFCSLPFDHSYIDPQYQRKLCCVAKEGFPEKKTTLENFWNSPYIKDIRKKMISGDMVNDCSNCTYAEQMGIPSLRLMIVNNLIENPEWYNKIIDGYNFETGEMSRGPTYFDYRTIHCNLQCVSCGDHSSSTHQQLSKNMGLGTGSKLDIEYEDTMAKEIIDALVAKRCETIYWAGGEPMMSKLHWTVFEKIKELSSDPDYSEYIKNLKTVYTTNLTQLHWKNEFIPELLECHSPHMHVSIDGVKETFEYCRDGARWKDIELNWKEYYSRLNKNNNFTVSSVLSAPVLFDIERFFVFLSEYDPIIHNHKLLTDINNPSNFLDIRLFPEHIFNRCIENAVNVFQKSNLRGADLSIGILRSYQIERQNNRHIFDNIDMLREIKNKTILRDKWLKGNNSFTDVLQLIDKEAYEWYISL